MIDVLSSAAPQSGNPLAVVVDADGVTVELPCAGHPTLGMARVLLRKPGARRG
jgi:predicted PhzF superfamily epimerase YddE/YHI9